MSLERSEVGDIAHVKDEIIAASLTRTEPTMSLENSSLDSVIAARLSPQNSSLDSVKEDTPSEVEDDTSLTTAEPDEESVLFASTPHACVRRSTRCSAASRIFRNATTGILLGIVVSTMLIVVLDFFDVFHAKESMKFTVSNMVHDPEERVVLEETLGLKFMTAEEDYMFDEELDRSYKELKLSEETLQLRVAEYDTETENLQQLREEGGEMEKLRNQLGLDRWCGDCIWKLGQKADCTARFNYVMSHYKHTDSSAKVGIMEATPQCDAKDFNEGKWCGDCEAKDHDDCDTRVQKFDLEHTFHFTDKTAKIWIMFEEPQCKLER